MSESPDRALRPARPSRQVRRLGLRGLLLGTLLGLSVQGGLAQTPAQTTAQTPAPAAPSTGAATSAPNAQTSQTTQTTQQRRTTAQPLSAAERQTLQALFTKSRPATLRIEQCVPTDPQDCADPDGVGSGVLIGEGGLALTAYHVVKDARALSAQTLDKVRHSVEVVGYDSQNDLAVLRVNVPKGTPYLKLAASKPAVGDPALGIGNGDGAFLQAKVGRLTALDAAAGLADFPPGTLELNAPLIPGDSGGPILNSKGEVAGIISYIRVTGRAPRSYAVPVTATDARLAELKRGVKRDTPVIGIGLGGVFSQLLLLDEAEFAEISDVLKLGSTPGAFFTSVSKGSPAEKAGLIPLQLGRNSERVAGDIVTEVNGKRIVNFSEFQFAVRAFVPGDTITLTVLRDGKSLKIPITLTGESQLKN